MRSLFRALEIYNWTIYTKGKSVLSHDLREIQRNALNEMVLEMFIVTLALTIIFFLFCVLEKSRIVHVYERH